MLKSTIGPAVLTVLLATAAAIASEGVHWSYEGQEGPDAWGGLSEDFATCGTGQMQSPIDVPSGVHAELQPLELDYDEARWLFRSAAMALR